MQKPYSKIAFLTSLLFHLLVIGALVLAFRTTDDVANSYAGEQSDQIAMEMLLASIQQQEITQTKAPETPPEPQEVEKVQEPVPQPTLQKPEPKPEIKEIIPDPLLQKVEPQKVVTEKVEQSKTTKPKKEKKKIDKKKDKKPKKTQAKSVAQAGNANINSKAQGREVTATKPNLQGKGVNSDELAAYRSALRREIERHKCYSQRARMLRQQGVVVVGFELMNDGRINNVHLVTSSGFNDLDQAALKAVSQANSVGDRPIGLGSNISIPIKFSLR